MSQDDSRGGAQTTAELIDLDVSGVESRDDALDRLLVLLERSGRLGDAAAVRRDVLLREDAGSTALPGGVAIPHARTAGMSLPTVAMLRLRSPVEWSEGAAPVDLVLGLFCPSDDRDGYLRLLASVARGVSGRLPRDLRAAETAEEALPILQQVLASA